MSNIMWLIDYSFISMILKPFIVVAVLFTIMLVVIIGLVIYSLGGSDDA